MDLIDKRVAAKRLEQLADQSFSEVKGVIHFIAALARVIESSNLPAAMGALRYILQFSDNYIKVTYGIDLAKEFPFPDEDPTTH